MVDSERERSERARQLGAICDELAVATADGATHGRLRPLADFLSQIRKALAMDVVFVSEFQDDQRVFRLVSAENAPPQLTVGASDPLVETYCKRVLDGRLPPVISDTSALQESAELAITERLNIGAYLSAPVILPSGKVFGTLCCLSHSPRPDLQRSDGEALRRVADAIAFALDKRGEFKSSWRL